MGELEDVMNESICPFCAEPIGLEDERCKSCGERLDDDGDTVRTGSARTVIVVALLGVLLVGGLVCVLPWFMFSARMAPGPVPAPAPAPFAVVPRLKLPPDPGQATVQDLQGLPLRCAKPGDTSVPCSVYGWGGFGLIDIGSARIAIRGVDIGGFFSDSEVTVESSSFSGSSSSTSSLNGHTLRFRTQDGVTVGNFDQVAFEIIDGVLTLALSGLQADTRGTGQVVVVDLDGSNAQLLPHTGPITPRAPAK